MRDLYTKVDFWTALIAMLGVLLFGILAGLLLAVTIGLLALLASAKNRSTSVLGKVPDDTSYRSLENFPDSETFPGLLILRFDGTMFFANTPEFSEEATEGVAETEPPPRVVLLDAEEITDIDATAIITMTELNDKLKALNIDLRFARVRTNVMEVMQRAGFEETIGSDHFYVSVQAGVDAYLSEPAEAQQAETPAEEPSPDDGSDAPAGDSTPAEEDPPQD